MSARNWREEFGDEYAIPAEILALVESGEMSDTSWHNDQMPSFGVEIESGDSVREIRIFVSHPDSAFDVNGEARFSVVDWIDGEAREGVDVETDDVLEAIATWREMRATELTAEQAAQCLRECVASHLQRARRVAAQSGSAGVGTFHDGPVAVTARRAGRGWVYDVASGAHPIASGMGRDVSDALGALIVALGESRRAVRGGP